MKLINSMTEDMLRKEMLSNQQSAQSNIRLLRVIKEKFPDVKKFSVVDFLMEQGEDIYTLIVDETVVTTLELSRVDESVIWVDCFSVAEYEKLLTSKFARLKFMVAVELSKEFYV